MNRAVVIGISKYHPPVPPLPAVAADVREIGKLLQSEDGSFHGQEVMVLSDQEASQSRVLKELEHVFRSAAPDDTIFVYMAGHGSVVNDDYYFIPHDCRVDHLPDTSVALTAIKRLFDECRSRRVFLWLDFCHSGGILARRLPAPAQPAHSDHDVIDRTLRVVQGQGKVIFAACTSAQSAYENAMVGHGLFTAALLAGLKEDAAQAGEVTATSLFDYIDRQMGSDQQRPMMFGHMTGRIVLMHYGAGRSKEQAISKAHAPGSDDLVVDSSGNWCLLDKQFFQTKGVLHGKDGKITVEIPSADAEMDAAIGRLRPGRYGGSERMAFAYRNDALLVRVENVESASAGEEQVWTVTLKPEDVEYGGGGMEMSYQANDRHYSADDIAKLRAGRILLNDPPPQKDNRGDFGSKAMLEMFLRGTGTHVSVEECTIRRLYKQYPNDPKLFLQLARLASTFMLKAGGVVAELHLLVLGPMRDGKVHVKFRGRRARFATNVEPTVIELEGDRPLE